MEIHLNPWEECHQKDFAARDEGIECSKEIISMTVQFAVGQRPQKIFHIRIKNFPHAMVTGSYCRQFRRAILKSNVH